VKRRHNKPPSRLHLLRALSCTCDPVGAERGCSDVGCKKCRMLDKCYHYLQRLYAEKFSSMTPLKEREPGGWT